MGTNHLGSTALLLSVLGCWLAADDGPATPRDGFPAQAPVAGEIARLVDSLVVAEALSRGVPGVAVAVVADGKVILRRGYGVADVTTGRRVSDTTPFNIASVTKPFTAAVVQLLAGEGRIQLDAPVSTYLPMPASYSRITVRQLLTHTSGIARDLRRDNDDDPDAAEYRRRLDASVPSAEPGTRFEYSNTGFTVLGWMVEAVEGRPLEEVFRRRLFGPLGMRQARYRAGFAQDPARARPHEVVGGVPGSATAISGGFGSGGLSLSAADFAAFAVALQGGRFLASAQLDTAWTPGRLADGTPAGARLNTDADGYGFGWFITTLDGRRLVTHGGGITGFSANLYHFPDERLTIAIVANVKGRDDRVAPVDPLARRIAGLVRVSPGR
ncbi:MAG: serine hydrolase domain-containing protein [Gemmatimonadales bacterium]|nr:serine hydrolase domain-containing protein [Gemmatimonadales bacterium]